MDALDPELLVGALALAVAAAVLLAQSGARMAFAATPDDCGNLRISNVKLEAGLNRVENRFDFEGR